MYEVQTGVELIETVKEEDQQKKNLHTNNKTDLKRTAKEQEKRHWIQNTEQLEK